MRQVFLTEDIVVITVDLHVIDGPLLQIALCPAAQGGGEGKQDGGQYQGQADQSHGFAGRAKLGENLAVEKEVFPGVLMGGGPVLPGGQQAAGQIHHRTEEERQVDKKKEQVGAQALLRNRQGVGPVHPRGQGDEEKADEGLDQEKGQQREKAPPLKTP